MPFTSNRFFLPPVVTRKTGQVDADGQPIREPAPGTHINCDPTGLPADLVAAMRVYEVHPATPQFDWGDPMRPPMCLRFESAEQAVAAAAPWGLWEFAEEEQL